MPTKKTAEQLRKEGLALKAKGIALKKKGQSQTFTKKLQGALDSALGSNKLRATGKAINTVLHGKKIIETKPVVKKEIKKINPTTVVDKTIYGGDRNVKYTDKSGNTYLTNKNNGKTTYVKKDKSGKIIEGNLKDDMGKITPFKETTFKEIKVTPPKKETPAQGKTVSELWKEKTGTSWSEAKKQGLTDGSAKANLALISKLKSEDYKPKAKEEPKVEPKVEPKISSYIKPNEVGPYYSKDEVVDPNKDKMGPMDDPNKPKLKRGGSIKSKITATKKPKMAMGGTKKIVLKKPMKKAMYGTAMKPMKPTMMQMGGAKKYLTGGTTGTPKYDDQPKKATTLKKAMYGTAMIKPTMQSDMMKKGGIVKKTIKKKK